MKCKKAGIPVVEIILILLFTTIVFILFAVLIFGGQQVDIEENHLKAQLISTTVIQNSCVFDEFGYVNSTLLTDVNLQECLGIVSKDKVGVRVVGPGGSALVNSNRFDRDYARCGIGGSTVSCFDQTFPIRYIAEDKNGVKYEKTDLLVVSIVLS